MSKTFIDTFVELRNGGAAIEMQEKLEQTIQGVRNTGKDGKLTLTLSIKPASKGGDVDMVFLADAIRAEVPQPNKKDTVFFVGVDNSLSRNDQRQMSMLDGIKDLEQEQRPAPKEVR